MKHVAPLFKKHVALLLRKRHVADVRAMFVGGICKLHHDMMLVHEFLDPPPKLLRVHGAADAPVV